MNEQPLQLTEPEQKAIVNVAVLAAFADGTLNEVEAKEIRRIAEQFLGPAAQVSLPVLQDAASSANLGGVTKDLASDNAKNVAYQMAVGICNADRSLTNSETKFLDALRRELSLDPLTSTAFASAAANIQQAPPMIANIAAPAPSGVDDMIRDRAILTGALELLPNRLATMAIVPIQMRMVYQIGKSFGYELDLGHTREFFATVGVGLTSQIVEGYLSKFVSHLARPFVGRFVAGIASQATESAIAFATTYALGQTAKTYYSGGRTITTAQLRDLFSAMLNDGRSLQSRYGTQIAQRAGSLKISDFVPAR